MGVKNFAEILIYPVQGIMIEYFRYTLLQHFFSISNCVVHSRMFANCYEYIL